MQNFVGQWIWLTFQAVVKCSIMINFFLLSNCKIETDRMDSVAMVADLGFFKLFPTTN